MMERLYTLREVREKKLIWYSSKDSIRKIIRAWKLEYIKTNEWKRPTYVISETAIKKFLENWKNI